MDFGIEKCIIVNTEKIKLWFWEHDAKWNYNSIHEYEDQQKYLGSQQARNHEEY